MLHNNKAIITFFGVFLLISMVFSQSYPAVLTIQNVDTDLGTLNIYMTNQAGCTYCDGGSGGTNETVCTAGGGVWAFDTSMNDADCTTASGDYFDGSVAAFQIVLEGITIEEATAPAGFMVSSSSSTILGFNLTGGTIPPGENVLLSTITFTGYDGSNLICFGEDTGATGTTLISDADGDYISANWGGCYDQNASIYQIVSNLPDEFSISQNYPNPFNPVTSISFDVAKMDEISLVVYDISGKEIITLASGIFMPGSYLVNWNAVNNVGDAIASGMYIYRYISSAKSMTRKMLYLK